MVTRSGFQTFPWLMTMTRRPLKDNSKKMSREFNENIPKWSLSLRMFTIFPSSKASFSSFASKPLTSFSCSFLNSATFRNWKKKIHLKLHRLAVFCNQCLSTKQKKTTSECNDQCEDLKTFDKTLNFSCLHLIRKFSVWIENLILILWLILNVCSGQLFSNLA